MPASAHIPSADVQSLDVVTLERPDHPSPHGWKLVLPPGTSIDVADMVGQMGLLLETAYCIVIEIAHADGGLRLSVTFNLRGLRPPTQAGQHLHEALETAGQDLDLIDAETDGFADFIATALVGAAQEVIAGATAASQAPS